MNENFEDASPSFRSSHRVCDRDVEIHCGHLSSPSFSFDDPTMQAIWTPLLDQLPSSRRKFELALTEPTTTVEGKVEGRFILCGVEESSELPKPSVEPRE